RPPGLRNALLPARKAGQATTEQEEGRAERGIVAIDRANALPDRWFGYAGVDVAVLSTGKLARQLLEPARSAERQALREWVRPGGRLVIDFGKNAQDAVEILDRLGLSEVGKYQVESVRGLQELQEWVGVSNDPFPGEGGVEVARF